MVITSLRYLDILEKSIKTVGLNELLNVFPEMLEGKLKNRIQKTPIVLFLGCSLTDSHFVSRDPYLPENSPYRKPRYLGYKGWTDHITEYLSDLDGENYLQINLGKTGGSMEFAMQSFIHALGVHGNKIKYVFWGGTEWSRMYFPMFRWPIEWSEDRLHNYSSLQNFENLILDFLLH